MTTEQQLALARSGDASALSHVLSDHIPQLERMVALRMDPRNSRRFEPADVVQDALVEATKRFGEWCAQSSFPIHLWLRLLTRQALSKAERRLHQQKREVGRDRVTAASAAEWLVSSHTSPTQAARRAEMCEIVRTALEQLDELDREILTLRHFEGLSNEEAATELGIEPAAASKRLTRALGRIQPALRALETQRAVDRE